jgi:hypothetical protein
MTVIIPDLPRLHTALAEWLACIIFIIPLKKRFKVIRLYLVRTLLVAFLIPVHLIGEKVPIAFWIPFMMLGLSIMYLCIFTCCDISPKHAGYIWARAFIAAELAASLEWQIYYYSYTSRWRI